MPRSSLIACAPVRIAMSSSIALRRSPKPGAFTAATFRPPRSLFTTRVASASPSTSSATMTRGLAACTTASSTGNSSCSPESFFSIEQDIGILHLDTHLVGVGDEIGRDVAAVELHSLDHFQLGLQRCRLLHGDDALVADFLHCIGEEPTDLGVAVGRDGADLGDFVVGGDFLGVLLEVGDDRLHRKVDAALEVHRVHAGGHRLGAFPDDGVSEHGRCRGAVAGLVRGSGRDLTDHLRPHVLELVLELDLLGDGYAVLGDAGSAEALVEDDVAAFRTEGHAHRVGERVDAAQHLVARVDRELDFLGSHVIVPLVA